MRPTADQICSQLHIAFPQAQVRVEDESHLHAGHAGASDGAGHFKVDITDTDLSQLRRIQAHRLVYDALQQWIPSGIHALSIHLHANHPKE
jgi:BolA family transcriptional regulator, general stress-responsive regulator